jgi:hypothetical protein
MVDYLNFIYFIMIPSDNDDDNTIDDNDADDVNISNKSHATMETFRLHNTNINDDADI